MGEQMVNIHFNDGSNSRMGHPAYTALLTIAQKYGVAASDLVTEECADGRTLVWLDEASAANDDGAHAVAEITNAPEPKYEPNYLQPGDYSVPNAGL